MAMVLALFLVHPAQGRHDDKKNLFKRLRHLAHEEPQISETPIVVKDLDDFVVEPAIKGEDGGGGELTGIDALRKQVEDAEVKRDKEKKELSLASATISLKSLQDDTTLTIEQLKASEDLLKHYKESITSDEDSQRVAEDDLQKLNKKIVEDREQNQKDTDHALATIDEYKASLAKLDKEMKEVQEALHSLMDGTVKDICVDCIVTEPYVPPLPPVFEDVSLPGDGKTEEENEAKQVNEAA